MSKHSSVEKSDALIERVRGEIRAQAATLRERPLLEREVPPAARDERNDRARLANRIGDLTDAHHQAFVEQAFHALLKRAPTPAETDAHLALLAAGATKAEALGNLRWSPEGRAIGAHVAGLAPRYAMAKLRRVPLLGYLVDIPLNLAALPALARHQRASDAMFAAGDGTTSQVVRELTARMEMFDARSTQAFEQLNAQTALAQRLNEQVAQAQRQHEEAVAAQHAREQAALAQQLRDKAAFAQQLHGHAVLAHELHGQATLAHQRLDDLHAFMHELNVARGELAQHFHDIDSSLRERIGALEGAHAGTVGRLDEMEFIRQRFYAVNHWTHHLEQAFARIEGAATQNNATRRQRALQLAEAEVVGDAARAARNAAWAKAFRADAVDAAQVFVCASGVDWSHELASLGCRVVHVDADAGAARANGIDVESADAFEALRRCADASLDGIAALSASHLVLASPLLDWLAEAHRALRPGAALFLADAREACVIADEWLRRALPPSASALASWSPALFTAAGFVDARRIDAADGTPAWLMRRAAA